MGRCARQASSSRRVEFRCKEASWAAAHKAMVSCQEGEAAYTKICMALCSPVRSLKLV